MSQLPIMWRCHVILRHINLQIVASCLHSTFQCRLHADTVSGRPVCTWKNWAHFQFTTLVECGFGVPSFCFYSLFQTHQLSLLMLIPPPLPPSCSCARSPDPLIFAHSIYFKKTITADYYINYANDPEHENLLTANFSF